MKQIINEAAGEGMLRKGKGLCSRDKWAYITSEGQRRTPALFDYTEVRTRKINCG